MDSRKSITVSEFVYTMRLYWKEGCGNVENEALVKTWEQIGTVILGKLFGDTETNSGKWDICSPPTGSGKSVSIKVLCGLLSRLSPDSQPGVLIVVRRKAEADRMAEEINTLGKRYGGLKEEDGPFAISYHSDNKRDHSIDSLREYPVVVVTHECFSRSLDPLKKTSVPWESLGAFLDRKRKGIIVDESLSLVEAHQLNQDDLRKLIGLIPTPIRNRFPVEIEVIESILTVFQMIDEKAGEMETIPDFMIAKEGIYKAHPDLPPTDFLALNQAMRDADIQRIFKRRNETTVNDSLLFVEETLAAVDAVINGFRWYKRKEGGIHTYNTARLLIPSDAPPVTMMDATATSNVIYSIFNLANPIPVVPGTRSYSNVTLHVSKNHRVGKRFMEEHAKELSDELLANLRGQPNLHGKHTLIVTHLGVEPFIKQGDSESINIETAHFGAVDGSNDFRHCSGVVVFGIQYRPDEWKSNVCFSCLGPQDSEWMQAGADRSLNGYSDIREAVATGQIISDIVQAANRGCCRCVIDDEGNCPSMDLYLLLPERGNLGEDILQGIVNVMPGIRVVSWEYKRETGDVPRTKHEAALHCYLRNMKPEEIKASRIRQELGIPKSTWERLVAKMQKEEANLLPPEVSYLVKRTGKTRTAYFLKGE